MTVPGFTLIGRDAELEHLAAALDADRWVVVVGEAGIGKTSLIRAALANIGRPAFEGGGFSTLNWMPYLALRRALGRPVTGDAAEVAATVEASVGPGLLFLDDLQWVDTASRAAIERLAGRIQLVAAVREGDPAAGDALALLGRAGALVVQLGGLADAGAASLVRRARRDLAPEAVERAVQQASGNPLLLEEMARAGDTSGIFGRALEERRQRLSDTARAGLDLLAIAGRPLAASAIPGGEELRRAGLATTTDDHIEIRHALLAEAIRAGLDEAALRSGHEAAAALIEDPAEGARHLLAAGRRGDAARLAEAALGETADLRARAPLLVVLAEATADPSRRLEAGTALTMLSDHAGVLAVLDEATLAAPGVGEEARVLQARALARSGNPGAGFEILEDVRAHLVDHSTRAASRLASELAQLLVNFRGEPQRAYDYLTAELAHQEDGTDDWVRIAALRGATRLWLGKSPDFDLLWRLWRGATFDPVSDAAGRATNLYAAIVSHQGGRAAYDFLVPAVARLEAAGLTSAALEIMPNLGQAAIFAGELRAAVAVTEDVLERPASLRARFQAAVRRADAYAYLGEFDLARASLELAEHSEHGEIVDRSETLMGEIELAFWSGAVGRAARLATELRELGSNSESNLVLPLKTGAWADLELGRPIRAVPEGGLPVLAAAPLEVAGIRLLAAGDAAAAAVSFEGAAAGWSGAVEPQAALCGWAAGEATRRAGDVPAAIERLRAAEVAASAMSFEPLVARIHRSLRLAGVRVAARRERLPGVALSRREGEVVGLVDQGLSNLEIARRLGLGRPTVARMLSSAMGKLGVERRTQLAARELV